MNNPSINATERSQAIANLAEHGNNNPTEQQISYEVDCIRREIEKQKTFFKNYHLLPLGTGGSTCCWTDRHAVTLVKIVSEKEVIVQEANAKIVSGSTQDGSAAYEFSPNLEGGLTTYTKRRPTRRNNNWKWVRKGESVNGGTRLALGEYDEYYDPHF